MNSFIKIIFISLISFFCFTNMAQAQGERKPVQFTGLVVGGEEMYGIPGVHVYLPKAGKGTITNKYGYFSIPTLVGDTVIISSLSYKRKTFVIPDTVGESMSVIVEMQTDTMLLPVVEILPYPTEALFKEAFLALDLPPTQREAMEKNLDEKVLARMFYDMDMDGSMNHSYYMEQQVIARSNKYMQPTVSLLNPFAWADFIKAVKRGDLRKKDWQREE